MDKTAIKNFSIWARNKLIADITYKAGLLGVTEDGIKDALPQSAQDAEFYDIGTKEPYAIHGEEIKQRKELVTVIKKKASQLAYKDAYRNVVEEVAYTWFNRLIAIRFMEVNDYMPAHIRVLSSESRNKLEPDLVTAPFDAELEFTQAETEKIMQMKNDNQVDALFRFMFIKQCNALNAYLPKLFEKTSDYTELLLNISVTDQDGIVYHLTHDINEDDFNISNIGEDGKPTGQVEIIGWMYQYYNTEPKDEAFALLKSNVKITKERIPAVTQLFTPDWIVRYMVENSLGRLWLEGHEDNNLKNEWKYYLDEAEQEADVEEQLKTIREEYKNIKPEEIKVLDPCMGSGHILVYAFDVLMQIYESCGYSQRDSAKSIVENNIYGLDIDDRAFQLAYFAVMMKARSYSRRFLTLGIEPNLCAIQESNGLQYDKDMGDFLLSEEHRETLQYLLKTFVDAKEYGSIINVEQHDYDGFLKAWELAADAVLENVVMIGWYNECNQVVPVLAKQAKILSGQYDTVITNPPYMGSKGMNSKLQKFVQTYYADAKTDLFACFIQKGFDLLKKCGFNTQVTMQVWMFLTAFDDFRQALLSQNHIVSLLHMDNMVMGIAFGTSASVFRKGYLPDYDARYVYAQMDDIGSDEKPHKFPVPNERLTVSSIKRYERIPRMPIAYWASNNNTAAYSNHKPISYYADVKKGMSTADDNRFLRMWYEIGADKFQVFTNFENAKWYCLNKGGSFRRWYGNNDFVVNWENEGSELKNFKNAVIRNESYYFRDKGLTWTYVTNYKLNVRYYEKAAFAAAGPGIFVDEVKLYYILGFLNTKVAQAYADNVGGETITYEVGEVASIPVAISDNILKKVTEIVRENISIAKQDWDSFETSWDFAQHPLIRCASFSMEEMQKDKKKHICDMNYIREAYTNWENECFVRFNQLKSNEEELNRIFIDIYGLQNELTPDVEDKDVTVRKSDLERDIRSFISYAVGCMFGRYSLEKEGLIFAGGDIKETYAYYGGTFADTSNIQLDGKYTFGELGTPFYYLPVEGKNPLDCWKVDADNIIPITDEEYFADDIVNRFAEFVKAVYGEETLEENLEFIANTLGNKGDSPRDIIRNYFLKDFYKDHIKVFQKRPIYWLFDSGRQNGFKALIYMHRYNVDTIGNLRVDYLHRMERIYESEINQMQDVIDNSDNAREATAASKRKEKLQKQLKECQEYDEKIGHLALSRIEIDLDDGVKVNYEKVQTARDGKKYQVLAKI